MTEDGSIKEMIEPGSFPPPAAGVWGLVPDELGLSLVQHPEELPAGEPRRRTPGSRNGILGFRAAAALPARRNPPRPRPAARPSRSRRSHPGQTSDDPSRHVPGAIAKARGGLALG
jgi:hypothetical protein